MPAGKSCSELGGLHLDFEGVDCSSVTATTLSLKAPSAAFVLFELEASSSVGWAMA